MKKEKKTLAIFPGTFEPFTIGHLNILEKAEAIFGKESVIVAVLSNPAKVSRETLSPSKFFKAQGMVIRSGWDDAAMVLSTRVGPNANHYHYDQGSFQIMKNGETLLTDPAYGPLGYYANLEYLSYSVQAIAHNVMLVDHDPESQAPAHYDNGIKALTEWPRVKHLFNGKDADGIERVKDSMNHSLIWQVSRILTRLISFQLFYQSLNPLRELLR